MARDKMMTPDQRKNEAATATLLKEWRDMAPDSPHESRVVVIDGKPHIGPDGKPLTFVFENRNGVLYATDSHGDVLSYPDFRREILLLWRQGAVSLQRQAPKNDSTDNTALDTVGPQLENPPISLKDAVKAALASAPEQQTPEPPPSYQRTHRPTHQQRSATAHV